MICRASAADIPQSGASETLIRIIGLKQAYGCDVPFIQYYTDRQGGYLSVMDGVGLLSVSSITDEWYAFIQMNPDIRILHCSGSVGRTLLEKGGWQGREGVVMCYDGICPPVTNDLCVTPYLPHVYDLLDKYFPGIAPFDYWYPDASHRVRHGCSHIACVMDNEKVVSTAMTVAETETEAIIGQVATAESFRRQGLAGKCIKSVVSQCEGKTLYILPIHEKAEQLYRDLGFVATDTWAELQKL